MNFSSSFSTREGHLTLGDKILSLNWGLLILLTLVAGTGFAALYSAGGGNVQPWADKHIMRYGVTLILCIGIALIDIRFWMRLSYVAYVGAFVLLVAVEIMGEMGMGAQRWINLGVVQIQPSELMKIGVIMALARYFHSRSSDHALGYRDLVMPGFLIAMPVMLVLNQPDLGTAIMIIAAGICILFCAGLKWRYFILGGIAVVAAIPLIWHFMHDYQKKRVLTFLNPEADPLGSGYHIMQSKIALGSGGIEGKGFLMGSQSHLNFLPEKQTDFIFTLLAEEWGLMGGAALLVLFGCIFIYGLMIALRSRHHYGRLLAYGLTFNFALYVFINIAMVTGLMPVVGVPLPLVSYGGTAMLTAMISFGLIMSVYIHRDVKIPRFL